MSPHLADRHLVGGEGPCFVRADDRGTAQGLHRGQAPHDGVLLCHPAGTQGQAGGDDSRKPYGDRDGVSKPGGERPSVAATPQPPKLSGHSPWDPSLLLYLEIFLPMR